MRTKSAAVQPNLGIKTVQRLGHWSRWWVRFARVQPLGAAGLVIIALAVFVAVFAPLITRYGPTEAIGADRLQPPNYVHLLGTDELGRDLYSRIIYGARVSLIVAFASMILGTGTGYLTGVISGYFGGKTDDLIQRVVDALLAFPPLLLALSMVAVLGPGIDKVVISISVTYAPRAARLSRGVVLSLKENAYVDAARVIGASSIRIMLRHILPNAMATYLILVSIGLGAAILIEASLSFLGPGVPPPHPSWGRMLSGAAQQYALLAPWLLVAPGVAIAMVVLAFNLFGDALRDVWDPKLRGR